MTVHEAVPNVRVLDNTDECPQTVFDDPSQLPADRDALTALGRRVGGADLAAPPVVLPDFHHKTKMEMPSSIAVATTVDRPARPSPAPRSTAAWR